ncbi:MAG: Oxygen-insensitive NADPH nitroreductase (EC [uncultured Thiotrichaceae bacterium]|uniref:Oxygen-insensitive NADPH nitroreductase (EC) n=1 Tax=uncultured Thiotrichaceae bacterium TaxID=298394 RepID=A0A6S6TH74_9GAMM|nr:MAG: Oxygen-insensitive NADPH nitroreductase (EC [uncultured Thiotrichaceae bacterium]
MNVIDALQQRKSVRAFLDKNVETDIIHNILDAAKHAPSGVNTQPWQVAVVSGASKQRLQSQIEHAFHEGDKGQAEYAYYPLEWLEPYKSRRKACGLKLYSSLEILREDKQGQMNQWAANYRAFDAPVMLFFFMDKQMQTGSYMDYGMFMQSIMLAAIHYGIATCPQAAFANYPHIIKPFLGYPTDNILVCGMALGYEDTDAVVNNYRTEREDVAQFTRYFDT